MFTLIQFPLGLNFISSVGSISLPYQIAKRHYVKIKDKVEPQHLHNKRFFSCHGFPVMERPHLFWLKLLKLVIITQAELYISRVGQQKWGLKGISGGEGLIVLFLFYSYFFNVFGHVNMYALLSTVLNAKKRNKQTVKDNKPTNVVDRRDCGKCLYNRKHAPTRGNRSRNLTLFLCRKRFTCS